MARIFYALSGDSRGHLSRAEAVVSRMKGHEFVFGGGGTVLELRAKGYEVVELPMLRTIMRENNRCDLGASASHILKVALNGRETVRSLADWLKNWGPDLIISDYDLFSQLAANRIGVRCVSLSHMHVVSHCRYDRLPGLYFNGALTSGWIRAVMSHCPHYIVSSFYALPPRNAQTTEIVPPILRPEVESVSATEGKRALVYLPNCAPEIMTDVFAGSEDSYVAYVKQPPADSKNMRFRGFDRKRFLEDLAGCRYVVSSAGHSLLSEALHFGKPVLCLPTKGLFEQHLNAHQLSRLGYGSMVPGLEAVADRTREFTRNLDSMRRAIEGMAPWGNEQVVEALEAHLAAG